MCTEKLGLGPIVLNFTWLSCILLPEQEHRIPMRNIGFKYVIPTSPSFATFLNDLQTDIRRGST